MGPSRGRRKAVAAAPSSPPLIYLGLIVLAGICVYWNSLHVPFIWDDQTAIVTNETIRRLWPLWNSSSSSSSPGPLNPPGETPVAGRPVVNLSFAINYAFGGLDPTGYHVWNLAVHLACAMLLFGIVRRTLLHGPAKAGHYRRDAEAGHYRSEGDQRSANATALAAALLWTVHPLASETIDYLTQRSESMMAIFVVLTLYGAIRSRDSTHGGRWEAAAIISCALGVATKESAAVAPVIVLLHDRVFAFGSFGEAIRRRKHLYAGLALTWVELGALMWHTERSTVTLGGSTGPRTYLLNQTGMIARYLRLTVWPDALVLDYGLPRALSIGDVLPQALLVVALLVATAIAFRRWPAIGFLGAVFFLTLAPTSSIVPIVSEVGAERRMYLPLAALVVLAVIAGRSVLVRLKPDTTEKGTKSASVVAGFSRTDAVAATVVTLVAIALGVRTVYRNQEYAVPASLWRTVVERRPHGRARMSYATELVSLGQHDEAIAQLERAVSDFPDARYALGTELVAAGKMDEGARELQEFIRRDPSKPDRIPARLLLGRVFIEQGRLQEAADQFKSVLERDPASGLARQGLGDVITSHVKLAEAALRSGALDEAASHARQAIGADPNSADAHNVFGIVLASQDKLDEAVVEFRRATEISPDHQQARNNLSRALRLSSDRRIR